MFKTNVSYQMRSLLEWTEERIVQLAAVRREWIKLKSWIAERLVLKKMSKNLIFFLKLARHLMIIQIFIKIVGNDNIGFFLILKYKKINRKFMSGFVVNDEKKNLPMQCNKMPK